LWQQPLKLLRVSASTVFGTPIIFSASHPIQLNRRAGMLRRADLHWTERRHARTSARPAKIQGDARWSSKTAGEPAPSETPNATRCADL
jgi:hypothetical protein